VLQIAAALWRPPARPPGTATVNAHLAAA